MDRRQIDVAASVDFYSIYDPLRRAMWVIFTPGGIEADDQMQT